jgi:hypothetical protein
MRFYSEFQQDGNCLGESARTPLPARARIRENFEPTSLRHSRGLDTLLIIRGMI